jgi:GTP-binding protein
MKKLPIIAIVGRTNVGKSSIFNTILHKRENIVAREEGTTRDSIMAKATYDNRDFWLVDTAGMKDAADDFEATIQEQIAQAIDSADVIWVVVEAGVVISQEDRDIAKLALKSDKIVFLVVNKCDQIKNPDANEYRKLGIKDICLVSATQGRGFDDLLTSLTEQIPRMKLDQPSDVIRIAIVGRPNVGKSLLFNTMLQKQQAVVSNRAGTTRDSNHLSVRYKGQSIELIDTAGIRRNGKIETGVEYFSVIRTISAIEQADVCLLLMDINELNVQLDQKIAGMVKEAGRGLILVVSKWDEMEDKEQHDHLMAQIKYNYSFVPWAGLVFTSSITGQNVARLFEMSLEVVEARKKFIKTPELNRWLRSVAVKHPPSGLKNRAPKLNYIVQEDDNPTPTFKVYGAHTKFLHWSYKRFMERELRESFGFEGTPIKFWFFEKHIDRKKPPKVQKEKV